MHSKCCFRVLVRCKNLVNNSCVHGVCDCALYSLYSYRYDWLNTMICRLIWTFSNSTMFEQMNKSATMANNTKKWITLTQTHTHALLTYASACFITVYSNDDVRHNNWLANIFGFSTQHRTSVSGICVFETWLRCFLFLSYSPPLPLSVSHILSISKYDILTFNTHTHTCTSTYR